jgi:hypothetical protein
MLAMVPAHWATMPLWLQQRCLHIDNGNDAIGTRARTPAWQWQQRHCNEGNNVIAMMAKKPELQKHMHIMMTTPLQQGQQGQLNNSKYACALMIARTPLLQGQQCLLNDYASSTMAEIPLQQGWQSALLDNGNNAIITRATISIAMMAQMPAHQWQQRHHNKGNNSSSTTCNKGNNASLTTVKTCALTTPMWRRTILIATMAMPAHQWQQRHHKKSNNASLITSNKGNSLTTVEMPAHQWRQ